MSKTFRYAMTTIALAVSLGSVEAHAYNLSCSGKGAFRVCDFTFTLTPPSVLLCPTVIDPLIYTIKNNTPVTMKINYIRVQNNDALANSVATIGTSPISNCGASLAAGASCNILLDLEPLALGVFNRVLQIGINTRQVQLDGPAITAAVNCTTPPSAAQPYIFGAAGVTNTATPTVVAGDLDVYPIAGTAITGFAGINAGGDGTLTNGGTFHTPTTDSPPGNVALAAYNAAVSLFTAEQILGLACIGGPTDLTGQDLGTVSTALAPLPSGTYCFSTSAQLTGTLYLGTSATSSYLFYTGTSLTTASNAQVVLENGALNSNVNWAIGSQATLGTATHFVGTIDAQTAITDDGGSTLAGRAWSTTAAVTLNDTTVNPN